MVISTQAYKAHTATLIAIANLLREASSQYISYSHLQAIHKKIQELNFVDCHTKIRQVDSQATIGDGVVVQVTGELSNQGGPMRRFMQTFVLAQQTSKQYYVNNDIFRYQDEVFQDSYESEEEAEAHSTEPGELRMFLKLCRSRCVTQHGMAALIVF